MSMVYMLSLTVGIISEELSFVETPLPLTSSLHALPSA